jgi:hypothetical protein
MVIFLFWLDTCAAILKRDTERVAVRAPAAYIMREFSLQGEAPKVDSVRHL